uniref:Uncharacterized protein LOC100182699 n=1 Tax=Phallusia mammillata TaxID=59560 RepID=A0A6F9DHX7_9ASCI|nr:uncharacterized protein LOC100182699 [Phallusia mammillata]
MLPIFRMNSIISDNDRLLAETSKSEFNKKCRRVSLKNIPCGVLNQDILELLKPYFYQQIHIDKNSQSCKAVLLDGECAARCIADLNGKFFRGQRLLVSLASCDFMLCITQLPLSYTHNQFLNLLAPFGTSERCFLVHSNITGKSKGYGCVEFTSKESSIKAKNHLNGAAIGNHALQVHWLDTIPSDYNGLYSSCLLVENLPSDFTDNLLLLELFSQFATPKFCQLANCEVNNFGVVEYCDPMHAEDSWYRLNNHVIGNMAIKVSFCVPGPCGLVVLNALRASRDLKRANPTGGLLPTPVQPIDHSVGSSILHLKKVAGVPCTNALGTIDTGILNANAVKDPEVQNLLSALHNRLAETNMAMSQAAPQMNSHPGLWSQAQHVMNPGLLNQFQQTENIPPHMIALRSRSGSISSCDSGARVEDDVFEPTRRKSQEDQFDNYSHQHYNISQAEERIISREGSIKYQNNQRTDTRCTSIYDSSGQQNFVPPSITNNPLLFLREDSQRSESADSAYSGSQGSSTSENSFSCVNPNNERPTSNQNCILNNPQHQTRHRPSGLLGDAPSIAPQYNHHKLPPGIQRFPPPSGQQPCFPLTDVAKQQVSSAKPILPYSGSSGSILHPTSKVSNANESIAMETTTTLPRGDSSAFNNVVVKHNFNRRVLPCPELKTDLDATRVPLTLFGGKAMINSNKADGFSSINDTEGNRACTSGTFTTPKCRHSRYTPNGAFSQHLNADSPTQLQLLGSSLMEGLLGDSPRSTAVGSSNGHWSISGNGNCRLLRALNLMSPTDCLATSPPTPTCVRKRGNGNVLPSPEPSPEAGAYVGQHSQGLGGHYADSYGLAGDICALVAGQRAHTPVTGYLQKRRRSNET